MKKVKIVEAFINILVEINKNLIGLFLVIMLSSVFLQVFTRFVIKFPIDWTEELSRYSFMWMAFLGASLGVKESSHFGVTIISDLVKERFRNYYFKFIYIIITIASAVYFQYGLKFALEYGFDRPSISMRMPMIYLFIAIPVSGVLMVIYGIYNVLFQDYSEDLTLVEELQENTKNSGEAINA